jgi:hypothetical protein
MNNLPWSEKVNMLSINPDAASREDIAKMAAELSEKDRELQKARKELDISSVAGVYMDRSIADFRRACEILIIEEEQKPNPDDSLISVLRDSIRLTRELTKVATGVNERAESAEAALAKSEEAATGGKYCWADAVKTYRWAVGQLLREKEALERRVYQLEKKLRDKEAGK